MESPDFLNFRGWQRRMPESRSPKALHNPRRQSAPPSPGLFIRQRKADMPPQSQQYPAPPPHRGLWSAQLEPEGMEVDESFTSPARQPARSDAEESMELGSPLSADVTDDADVTSDGDAAAAGDVSILDSMVNLVSSGLSMVKREKPDPGYDQYLHQGPSGYHDNSTLDISHPTPRRRLVTPADVSEDQLITSSDEESRDFSVTSHMNQSSLNQSLNSSVRLPDVSLPNIRYASVVPPPARRRCSARWALLLTLMTSSLLLVGKHYYDHVCDSNLGQLSVTSLRAALQRHVFGQHLAVELVPGLLQRHLADRAAGTGSDALVLAFHGTSGIGKNFISRIVTEHLPTANVQNFVITHHFPHQQRDDEYFKNIQDWLLGNVTSCNINVFIIDEVEKASLGVVMGLEEALKTLRTRGVLDRRTRLVVLLLSNTRGIHINGYVLRQLEAGRSREQITEQELVDMMLTPSKTTVTSRTEDWHIDMFQAGLLDRIIPFLPLERRHVRQCIARELKLKADDARALSSDVTEEVMGHLTFFPSHDPRFCTSGCRDVANTVPYVLG